METTKNGKAKIRKSMDGISVSIPSRKHILLLGGTFLWLLGWVWAYFMIFYEGQFGREIFSTDGFLPVSIFMIIWLTLWTAGGLVAIFSLIWGLFGREEFTLIGQEVHYKKHIGGIGKNRILHASDLRNFRFNPHAADWHRRRNPFHVMGVTDGKIKFDYGMKTYSMGMGVDDADANHIITEIEAYRG